MQPGPRNWLIFASIPPIWDSTALWYSEMEVCGLITRGLATFLCGINPGRRTSSTSWSWQPTLKDISQNPTWNFSPSLSTRSLLSRQYHQRAWLIHATVHTTPQTSRRACVRLPLSTQWYLLRIRALRFRQFSLNPPIFYHLVQDNCMENDAYFLFDLPGTSFLIHMSYAYLQPLSLWHIYPPPSELISFVISMMHSNSCPPYQISSEAPCNLL